MAKDEEKPKRRKGARGQMIRRVSYLWPDEDAALRQEAEEKEVSAGEVIRRALRSYLRLDPP